MRMKNSMGIWIPLVLLLAGCLLVSCGKKPEEQEGLEPAAGEEQPAGEEAAGEEEGAETAEAGEIAPVSEDDVTETDEDLLSVDYSQFYDDLSPHGKWIEVSAKDLGLDPGKKEAALAPTPGGKPSFWDRVSIIKSAHAQTATATASASASVSADFSFYVWVPSPELYVSAEAEAEASYTPYSNGQWIYTDAGWYFKAATPAEEITSHYGRWTLSGSLGWVWVPGRVWAPAWVAWREDDNYVAWTPVPPKVYLSGEVLVAPDIEDEKLYVIVEKKHFLEPAVFKYRFMYKMAAEPVSIKVMTKRDGIMIKEKRLINWGPNIVHIQAKTGKKINVVSIHRVGAPGHVKYLDGEMHVYAPKFNKVKVKAKVEGEARGAVSAPKVSVKYKEAKKAMKSGKLFVDVKGEAGADVKVKVKGDDVKVKVKDDAKTKVDVKTKAKGGVDVKTKGAGADVKVKTGGKGGVGVDLKGGAKVETGAKAGASAKGGASAGASTGGKKKKK